MIILTYHAVEQYLTRFEPGGSAEAAWEYLSEQLPYADRLKERSLRGDTLWRLPCAAYLVTRRGSRGDDVAVTILREPTEARRAGPTDEELELLLDRAEAVVPVERETGSVRLVVDIDYSLGAQNAPLVDERLLSATRTLLGKLKQSEHQKARVVLVTVRKASE